MMFCRSARKIAHAEGTAEGSDWRVVIVMLSLSKAPSPQRAAGAGAHYQRYYETD
jgi:hypothetical protein